MSFTGVGIGGWTYAPWRGQLYPTGLRQADELSFAAQTFSSLEINATYHKLHGPEDFARWARQTPPGFRFAVKASRLCTNRRVLAEAGEAVTRFLGQGLAELGPGLGPILWQFMPTKKFDREDFARFLDLLPGQICGQDLRHALEPRHVSFADQSFVDLCRARDVAICMSDHATYPLIEETTAKFTYARLMRLNETEADGYPPGDLDAWARRLRARAGTGDLYVYFIGAGEAGKIRAPAAAMGLRKRLQELEGLTAPPGQGAPSKK